jgi:transcription-repair coupling factor (superfamily II helicase)
MVCYFISNEDSPYYQTAKFTKVLRFVQKNQYTVKMEEKNKRLTLSFSDIKDIPQAINSLNKILVEN